MYIYIYIYVYIILTLRPFFRNTAKYFIATRHLFKILYHKDPQHTECLNLTEAR